MDFSLTGCCSSDATFKSTVPELKLKCAGISCKTKLQSELNVQCLISKVDSQKIKNTGCETRVTEDKLTFNIQPNHTLVTKGLYSSVLQEMQQNISSLLPVWRDDF